MRRFMAGCLGMVLMLMLVMAGCGQNADDSGESPADTGMKVVTTTTLSADIVQQVARDRVTVVNIIPPGSCPGHFDVKPADMQVLADAELFFVHAWQGEMFTDELIRAAHNDELQKVVLAVEGNWLAPPVQTEAIDKISAALAAADPENADFYLDNAAELQETVAKTGRETKERFDAAGVGEVKVLVNEMQAGFLAWAGFDVIAPFGRPDDTSPKELEELLARGRNAGVSLVVDNLQSGHEAGKGMARELGAQHVTLSNFPGGFEGTGTWALTVERNADLLLELLDSEE